MTVSREQMAKEALKAAADTREPHAFPRYVLFLLDELKKTERELAEVRVGVINFEPGRVVTRPALVRHRSFLMAALLTGAILDALTVLTYVALGEWLNVLWLTLFLCVVCTSFVVVRDYRG